jgi:hypothetical protein
MSEEYDTDASITDQAGVEIQWPDPGLDFEVSVGDTTLKTEIGFNAFVGGQRTLSASHQQIKKTNLKCDIS